MSPIDSKHNLGGFDKDQTTDATAGRSDYCYLFRDAANQPDAGRFTMSAGDDAETIQRLLSCATWMERVNSNNPVEDLKLRIRLPAAFTYFGQFVNHDLSAPVGSMLGLVEDIPDSVIIGQEQLPGVGKLWRAHTAEEITRRIRNEHATPLNLDSLYGEGPFRAVGERTADEVRGLYDADGLRFVLGTTRDASAETHGQFKNPVERVIGAPDLPRQRVGGKLVTLIADQRNDGNLILAQLHLALMLLHNKAVDALCPQNPDPADCFACFAAARRLVTRHYHWCIRHDFLPRILSEGALEGAIQGPLLFKQDARGKVPMEFTTAAYRFGHSLISGSYDYNSNFGTGRSLQPTATLIDLFAFTSSGDMKGQDQLPDHWVIDWNRMTADEAENATPDRSRSEQIDLRFAQGLMSAVVNAPTHELESIVARNLVRGFHRRIPFGQILADLCEEPVLTPEDICKAMPNALAEDPMHPDTGDEAMRRMELASQTPAWLYFLCEAKLREGGERLGPTASRIIAETFVTLMRPKDGAVADDDTSVWEPAQSPLRTADGYPVATLRDLLLFAVAPVGG